VKLGLQDATVSKVIERARYAVGIPRTVVDARGGLAWVEGKIASALASAQLVVTRRIDGIGKRVDVRDYLRELRVDDGLARQQLARAGVVGDLVALAAEVDVRGSGGVKIAEVIEAAFGDAELPHRSVRTGLGSAGPDGGIVSPLDLDVLRLLRGSRAPASASAPTDAVDPKPGDPATS
jgi:hypothetical protein